MKVDRDIPQLTNMAGVHDLHRVGSDLHFSAGTAEFADIVRVLGEQEARALTAVPPALEQLLLRHYGNDSAEQNPPRTSEEKPAHGDTAMTAHTVSQRQSRSHNTQSSRRHRATAMNTAQASPLTELPVLLDFMLHRDRWRSPIWLLRMAGRMAGLMAGLMAYFANAIGTVMDQTALASVQVPSRTPALRAAAVKNASPMPPILPPSSQRNTVSTSCSRLLCCRSQGQPITKAAMHTRAKEQTGRAELVRVSGASLHSTFGAAFILAFGMNVVASVLMSPTFWFSTALPASSRSVLLFCASVGVLESAFASTTSVAIQLSAYFHGAAGIAGAVRALNFVVRGFSDMSSLENGVLVVSHRYAGFPVVHGRGLLR